MKSPLRILATAAALLCGAAALPAQPEIKLIVVDMAKVFDNHYQKAEADIKFRDSEQSAREELEQMNKEGQAMVEQLRALDERSKNTVLTEDARNKARTEAETKFQEVQQLQNRIQEYRQAATNQLQQRIKTHRDLLLDGISKTVVEIARRKGATLVVDKSGPSLFGISNIIYTDPAYDITDEVLAAVNKDRPPAAAGAAPKAAPASTPPATTSGTVAPLFSPGAASQPKKP